MATQVICDACSGVIDTAEPYYQAVVTQVKVNPDGALETVEAARTLDYHIEHLPRTGPAAPTVSSLNPAEVASGSDDAPLHVFGTGFRAESVIVFNNVDHATTYYDDTHLTCVLAKDNLKTDGDYPVVVRNPDGQKSSALDFTVT